MTKVTLQERAIVEAFISDHGVTVVVPGRRTYQESDWSRFQGFSDHDRNRARSRVTAMLHVASMREREGSLAEASAYESKARALAKHFGVRIEL
jgi:hypothetical protein